MKHLLLSPLIFIISSSSFKAYAFEGLHYRIIQTWDSNSNNNLILQRSWWKFNRFNTLRECEEAMMKRIYNSSYSTYTIKVLNNYDNFEYRKVIYQRRKDGTLQVQWGCLDFKN